MCSFRLLFLFFVEVVVMRKNFNQEIVLNSLLGFPEVCLHTNLRGCVNLSSDGLGYVERYGIEHSQRCVWTNLARVQSSFVFTTTLQTIN